MGVRRIGVVAVVLVAVAATAQVSAAAQTVPEPLQVTSEPEYGSVTTRWNPSAGSAGDEVDGYQVRLVDFSDSSRNRSVDVSAETRQHTFTQLAQNRRYRVDVGIGGVFTEGPDLYPSTIALTVRASQNVPWGGQADLRGAARCSTLYFTEGDGVDVRVQRRFTSTGSWVTFDRNRVAANKFAIFPLTPRHTQYRVLFPPGAYEDRVCMGYVGSVVSARAGMYVSITPRPLPQFVRRLAFEGTVRPAHPGMSVRLQRKFSSGVWRTERTTRLDGESRYRFAFTKSPGRYVYRVVAPADKHHNAGYSLTTHPRVTG